MAKKGSLRATQFLPKGMTLKQYAGLCGKEKSLICPKCNTAINFRKKFLDCASGVFKNEKLVLCLHCLAAIDVKTGAVM